VGTSSNEFVNLKQESPVPRGGEEAGEKKMFRGGNALGLLQLNMPGWWKGAMVQKRHPSL